MRDDGTIVDGFTIIEPGHADYDRWVAWMKRTGLWDPATP